MDHVELIGTEAQLGTGDPYEELFFREFVKMRTLAGLLGSDDPENVAQEAFARLHRKFDGLSDPGRAVHYLRATVVNLTRSRLRHLMVVHRHTLAATVELGNYRSAEAEVLALPEFHLVTQALRQLSPRHREVIVLRFWADLPIAEVAQAMGTSVGTAKSQISRALCALRPLVEEL